MTPEDRAYLEGPFLNNIVNRVWKYLLPAAEGYGQDTAESRLNYSAIKIANTLIPQLAGMPDAVWKYPLPTTEGVTGDITANAVNYTRIRTYDTILPQLAALNEKVDKLALSTGDADALKAAVEEIVRGVLNDTVLEVRPPS